MLWLLAIVFIVMIVVIAEEVDRRQKITLEQQAEIEPRQHISIAPGIQTLPPLMHQYLFAGFEHNLDDDDLSDD